jgi:glycosyltransferase involved in cell wall biosynthesis
VVGKNVVVFVIGKYDSYEMNMEKHSDLKEYVYYNGFSGDILSRIELCDLYLNPLRKGGGTSAVEAMYKGKPVVTIAYGDVAGIVGEDFCCADYSEMEKEIKRYASDREYYAIQSQKAKRLSEKYLDSEREFKRIIEEYLRIMN